MTAALPACSISPTQIQQARATARTSGRSPVEVLAETHDSGQAAVLAALGELLGMPYCPMDSLRAMEPQFDRIGYSEASNRQILAARDETGRLCLVVTDPFAEALVSWATERLATPARLVLAAPADLTALLSSHEDGLRAMDAVSTAEAAPSGPAAKVEDLSLAAISEDSSPIVKLVNSTLYDALKSRTSDIHLKTHPKGMTIKYRVDGVLVVAGELPGRDAADQVISRIKVMAELDIAERRVPQDGRFKVQMRGRDIDIRVSIMPSLAGEDAALRILDKQSLAEEFAGLSLDVLGFDEPTKTFIRRLSLEPYGMLLVTGPTGSGKTTTLYATLSEINSGEDNIITIEDPVEYYLPGVLQIPVNEKKGLTFARGLRSILRHDPDKILVGEIRDAETAQIAVQSALTGHLVFTTVHANNAFDVIGRFAHMGVDVYSFVSALNAVVAQRLVRMVCPSCKAHATPDPALLAASGLDPDRTRDFRFVRGLGCGQCRGTGYRGRRAIAETLQLNDQLREMLIGRVPMSQVKEVARAQGTRFLREAALELVRTGETTLQEINRVTFV